MTNNVFERLAKQVLPNLPGYFVKGSLAASHPVKHVLRGVYFEGSSFDAKSFYVWAFFLPLFVPTKHVSFNLGKRLREPGGGDRWNVDASNLLADLRAAVKRDALPFLSGIESAEDIANAAARFQNAGDPFAQQTIAYSYARAGNVARATEELERLIRLLALNIPWQREIAEKAELLKEKLADPAQTRTQFEAWENESVRNLGLEEFRQ